MEDCVFCKIGKGEIPVYKVFENEKFIAFLDHNPFALGHTLLIPKKHAEWIWDLAEKDYLEMMSFAKKISEALQKTFDTKWIIVGVVGIDVAHAHIHLIPRQFEDGLGKKIMGTVPPKALEPKPSEKEMKEAVEKIKKNL